MSERELISASTSAGVIVTVNSDDPPLFNTTLNDEVQLLSDPFGLGVPSIDDVLLNGVRHSFLPEGRKHELIIEFQADLALLRDAYLLRA